MIQDNSDPSSVSEERTIEGSGINNGGIYDNTTDIMKKSRNRLEHFSRKEVYKDSIISKVKKKVTISSELSRQEDMSSKSEKELIKKIANQFVEKTKEEEVEEDHSGPRGSAALAERRGSGASKTISDNDLPISIPKENLKLNFLYPHSQGPMKLVWKRNVFLIAILIRKFVRNLKDSIIYYSTSPLSTTHYAFIGDKSHINEDELGLNDLGKKGNRNERIRELTKTRRGPGVLAFFNLLVETTIKINYFPVQEHVRRFKYNGKPTNMDTLRKKSRCKL
jgi:hypothetical protein